MPPARTCAPLPVAPWLSLLLSLLLPLLFLGAGASPVQAQGALSGGAEAHCPEGNLLAGRRPWQWREIRGRLEAPTDGRAAREGGVWHAPVATILASAAATMTWDLGQVVPVRAVWLQADNNDDYHLWGSRDGVTFAHLGTVPSVPAVGLRGRSLSLPGAGVRFLRVGEPAGDGSYSLAEIQAFCRPPGSLPAAPLERVPVALATAALGLYAYWNDASSARWELVLACLGFALLFWGWRLERRGRGHLHRRLRDRLLAGLGLLSALTFFNFGFFHFGNFIHVHEWTHYYVGSKYLPELGYTRMYECLSLADIEHGLRRRVELRRVIDLESNLVQKAPRVLADPGHCRRHFSDQRWRAFTHDVAFFRARMAPAYWDKILLDHGYNATPVWNTTGSFLAGLAPASPTQLYLLALLDPIFLLATLAVVGWAFGWRLLAVALLVFATNFPSRFYWTGGAFLRWDWLFYLVAAIACLKKQRPALAGAALAQATLLRVFPLFVFAGPLLAGAWQLWRERRPPPWLRRFVLGAALATALLVPLSLVRSGGVATYRAFVENTVKHKETPLVNHLGLRTVLSWRPHNVARFTLDERDVDPWQKWRAARLSAFRDLRFVHLALVLGYLVLLARVARRAAPWVSAALGVGLIAFGVELTSYYYMFILAVALLHAERTEVGLLLLLLTAFTQLVAWAPFRGMATWDDEKHAAMAAGSVIVFGVILALSAWPPSASGMPDPASGRATAPPGPPRGAAGGSARGTILA